MDQQTQIPEGYMTDSRGALVPVDMVTEIDKLRDELVREIVAKAKSLSDMIATTKAAMMDDIAAFIQLSAEKYHVSLGGKKGNVTLATFDGRYKVLRAIGEYIVFDERLQVAKKLIDECLHEWTDGSRSEIQTIINHAFEVDKQGKINTERILSLRRLAIDDPKWKKAMEAISDSVQVAGSKAYVRVYERKDNGSYGQINMDMASA